MPEHRLSVKRANRLDKAISTLLPSISRSAAQRLIDAGLVRVNGALKDAAYFVSPGDVINVAEPEPVAATPQPEALPIDVIYEDADLVVVNKAAGWVVHPGAGNAAGTLVNAMLAHAPEIAAVGDETRPGIVHRLDKETSGVLMIAKTEAAYRMLQAQFKARQIQKTYLAVCIGTVLPLRGTINKPIARDPGNRQRMAVLAGGREAVTEFAVTEHIRIAGRPYSFVRLSPRTGRTHQLRVHMTSIGFPIVGDLLYGAKRDPFSVSIAPRHLLHASELRVALPATGEPQRFYAPMPDDMRAILDSASAV